MKVCSQKKKSESLNLLANKRQVVSAGSFLAFLNCNKRLTTLSDDNKTLAVQDTADEAMALDSQSDSLAMVEQLPTLDGLRPE